MSDDKKSQAASILGRSGAAKGGKARAAALTPEQRSESSRAAVIARWRKQKGAAYVPPDLDDLPVVTHGSPDHPLVIGEIAIPCYVLADGRRVLVQNGMLTALGMSKGGSSHGGDRLAKFVSADRLKGFVSSNLIDGTRGVRFSLPSGIVAFGYEATILADICDAVLAARKEGVLQAQQAHIAAQCEILVRAFARVGIIALVDEATGYQADRAKDALARILEQFIAKELRKWIKTFPAEFYQEMFRLRRIPYTGQVKRPSYIGHLTNDLVYSRLAPGVLAELRAKNPAVDDGRRKHKHFQWLTGETGHPKLLQHLASVIALMKASDSWEGFKKLLDRALPPYKPLPLFDGIDDRQ